jgi:hypothetical protein
MLKGLRECGQLVESLEENIYGWELATNLGWNSFTSSSTVKLFWESDHPLSIKTWEAFFVPADCNITQTRTSGCAPKRRNLIQDLWKKYVFDCKNKDWSPIGPKFWRVTEAFCPPPVCWDDAPGSQTKCLPNWLPFTACKSRFDILTYKIIYLKIKQKREKNVTSIPDSTTQFLDRNAGVRNQGRKQHPTGKTFHGLQTVVFPLFMTQEICLDLRNFDLETVAYREYSSDRRQVGLVPLSEHKELEQVFFFGNVAIPEVRTPKRPRMLTDAHIPRRRWVCSTGNGTLNYSVTWQQMNTPWKRSDKVIDPHAVRRRFTEKKLLTALSISIKASCVDA